MTSRAGRQVRTALNLSTNPMTIHALLAKVLHVKRVIKLFGLEIDLAAKQIAVTPKARICVFLLPRMMTVRTTFRTKSEHFFRRLFLVRSVTRSALETLRDVWLVHEIDVEHPAGLFFDSAVAFETSAFKRSLRPPSREWLHSFFRQRLIDQVVTCVEKREAVFDIVSADASIDQLDIRIGVRERPRLVRSAEISSRLHPL